METRAIAASSPKARVCAVAPVGPARRPYPLSPPDLSHATARLPQHSSADVLRQTPASAPVCGSGYTSWRRLADDGRIWLFQAVGPFAWLGNGTLVV